MISPVHVAIAEYILDRHNAVGVLADGMNRSTRGRPSDRNVLRLLLLGIFLSIQNARSGTVRSAHTVLRTQVPINEQIRLEFTRVVVTEGATKLMYIPETRFYDWIKALKKYLNCGFGEAPDINDLERARRWEVIHRFNNALCDAFEDFFGSDTVAVDATHLWAHHRGRKIPDKILKQLSKQPDTTTDNTSGDTKGDKKAAGTDDETGIMGLGAVDELVTVGTDGDESSGIDLTEVDLTKLDLTGIDLSGLDPATDLTKVDLSTLDESVGEEAAGAVRAKVLEVLNTPDPDAPASKQNNREPGVSHDRDGRWWAKQVKKGRDKLYFGYQLHALAQVFGDLPRDSVPVLITRYVVTPGTDDPIAPTLGMLDSLNKPVKHLIADRLYPWAVWRRWWAQLKTRKIEQHIDLREDQTRLQPYNGLEWVGGVPHCPAIPAHFDGITRPGNNATTEEHEAVIEIIEKRQAYAAERHSAVRADGTARYICPARAGKVGCPLVAGSLEAAAIHNLPVVENPPTDADGNPIHKICRQQTFQTRPHDTMIKTMQPEYWASRPWYRWYRQRTYVESEFGNLKSPDCENVHRGYHRLAGVTLNNIVTGLAVAALNLRMLRTWHDRTGLGDPTHPLLTPNPEPEDSQYLAISRDQLAELDTRDGSPVDDAGGDAEDDESDERRGENHG